MQLQPVDGLDLYTDNADSHSRQSEPPLSHDKLISATHTVSPQRDRADTTTVMQRIPRHQRQQPRTCRTRFLEKVQNGEFNFPKSSYEGWLPTCPALPEREAIDRILASRKDAPPADYLTVDLSDFSVYRSPRALKRPGELTMLSTLQVEAGVDDLCFDGYITINGERIFLKGVSFSIMAIEGYGLDSGYVSVDNDVSVQTPQSAKTSIWYRLCRPSSEYGRYHDTFLWIANLTKYVIDFMSESESLIGLHAFRHQFISWSRLTYGQSSKFRNWSSLMQGTDFRSAVSAHIQYIWKEAFSVDESLRTHPLWGETNTMQLNAVPTSSSGNNSGITIVTPFVFKIFKDMYFASVLQVQERSPDVAILAEQRRQTLGLTPLTNFKTVAPDLHPCESHTFSVGEVVAIRPDDDSPWKSAQSVWYAYIQGVRYGKDASPKLDLLWLYSPCDTVIGKSPYPFNNELFLSDNCSCGRDSYDAGLVIGKIQVQWDTMDPILAQQANSWIVRRTYYSHTDEFVTLQSSHFRCKCSEPATSDFDQVCSDFPRGSFVLVRGSKSKYGTRNDAYLRPAQILQVLHADRTILLRRLSAVSLRSNEVKWSNDSFLVSSKAIVRHCTVKGFPSTASVTELYRRGGVGDLFYYLYHGADPNTHATGGAFRQEPTPSVPKLRGMGICCGGGSFDRGLEDSNGITFEHAIDIDQQAIHTYRANMEDPGAADLFLGPMEDYLYNAMSGTNPLKTRAVIGTVDLIAAGCPCQAFSLLQSNKVSKMSIKRASLVACVMAYVEHYMPSYFVLENVLGIAGNIKGMSTNQNILSRMICCLVGLGYQTQQFVLDSSAHHGSQSRRRVFVIATAPGLEPPERPPQSSHRADGERFRSFSLGKLSNGVRFGGSQDELAPFPMVSFRENTKDLPDISDGHIGACIPLPDHRLGCRQGIQYRNVMTMIPRLPRGIGFAYAARMGKLSEPVLARWPERIQGKAFTRLHPDKVMPTITTVLRPLDSYAGVTLHPDQHRVLTVMEARRGQGIPDHEVILGTPEQQWKVIGNSVHRNVAFALGCSIRDAWWKSQGKPLLQAGDKNRVHLSWEAVKDDERGTRLTERPSTEQKSSTLSLSSSVPIVLAERSQTTTITTTTVMAVQSQTTKRKRVDAGVKNTVEKRKWPRWRA